jgi:hypothetical protein
LKNLANQELRLSRFLWMKMDLEVEKRQIRVEKSGSFG